jgi:hypothetical protein
LLSAALDKAGDNRGELERALDGAPDDERAGMRFILAYMPERDLTTLSADFLLENSKWAHRAWRESPWRDEVPVEVFHNEVLPYVSINERRDDWRKDFYKQFKPLVKDAKTPTEAAAMLNQKVFPILKVRYSTKRKKADQSPYESMEGGTASCTGLSIILIDACRAVGVPARFVGTPLWADKSGNHSWVEIWDDGWHFTGACEPTGDKLDKGWFIARASQAQRDHDLHSIFAISYRDTPGRFRLRWRRGENLDYIHTVNVTDRYTRLGKKLPEGHVYVGFRVIAKPSGERVSLPLVVKDAKGEVVFQGHSNDERFDANDHLTTGVALGSKLVVQVKTDSGVKAQKLQVSKPGLLVTIHLEE